MKRPKNLAELRKMAKDMMDCCDDMMGTETPEEEQAHGEEEAGEPNSMKEMPMKRMKREMD